MKPIAADTCRLFLSGSFILSAAAACGGRADADPQVIQPQGDGPAVDSGAPDSEATPGNGASSDDAGGAAGGAPAMGGAPADGGNAGAAAEGGAPAMGGAAPEPPVEPLPPVTGEPTIVPNPPGGELPPPAVGCQPEKQYDDETSCSLALGCDNASVRSRCYDRGDRWSCDCSREGSKGVAFLDVKGSTACVIAADLCANSMQPDFGPPICESGEDISRNGVCEKSSLCTEQAELDGGEVVERFTQNRVLCQEEGDTAECGCRSGGTSLGVTLEGSESPCNTAFGVCTGPALEFDSEPECSASDLNEANGLCEATRSCKATLQVAPGIVATQSVGTFVNCSADAGMGADAGSHCQCSVRGAGLFEDVAFESAESPRKETCSVAMELCAERDNIELSGPVSCASESLTVDEGSCRTAGRCRQDGTLAGRDLVFHGSFLWSCEASATSSSWDCICNGASITTGVTVEAADETAACTALIDLCPQEVEIAIGLGGRQPVPLPSPQQAR